MGKARSFSNESQEANYRKEYDDEIYTASTQQNSYNLGSVHFSDQSGIGNFAQSGSDQTKADLRGALFSGNQGFEAQNALLDVTTETINLQLDNNNNPLPRVATIKLIFLSSGTTANLSKITGAERPGQRLILCALVGNNITIKDAGSSTDPDLIHTPGNADYTLANTDAAELIYDLQENQWRMLTSIGAPAAGGYSNIQDEGLALTSRNTMNFIGDIVQATDDPANNRTNITISSPSGTIPPGTAENQHLEWNNTTSTFEVVDVLTFGTTGPFATSGFINTANNQTITSSRNNANTGDISIKVDSSDRIVFEFPTMTGTTIPFEISSNQLDVKTVDIINIDQAKFVNDGSALLPNSTDNALLVNSGSQFQFNTGISNNFVFSFNNNAAIVFDHSSVMGNEFRSLTIQSDSNDTNSVSNLNITRANTMASGQEIGQIGFNAPDTNNSGVLEYAAIASGIEDATPGSIDGSMRFDATVNGSVNTFLQINEASSNTVEFLKNIDLNANNITDSGSMLFTNRMQEIGDTTNPLNNLFVNNIRFQSGIVTVNNPMITAINDELILNVPTINDIFEFKFGGTTRVTISNGAVKVPDGGGINFQNGSITQANTGLPLNFLVPSATFETQDPGVMQFLLRGRVNGNNIVPSQIIFEGENSTNAIHEYALIKTRIISNTDGMESGALEFEAYSSGSASLFLQLNGDQNQIIFHHNIFMNADILMGTNFTQFQETTNPGATMDSAKLYAKQDTDTITKLFYVDSNGTEVGPILGGSIAGNVSGPASSSNNQIALFADATGTLIKNSSVTLNGGILGFLSSIEFSTSGGEIVTQSTAPHMNFKLDDTGDLFRFTLSSTDILDISNNGIDLNNRDLTDVNQIVFDQGNQSIADNVNGLRYSVPAADTHDFIVDGNTSISIQRFFLNLTDTRIQMQSTTAPANPPANNLYIYSQAVGGFSRLFYRDSNGQEFGPLEGPPNEIIQGDSRVTVTDAGTGSISNVIDGTEQLSIGPNIVSVPNNFAVSGFADLQGDVDLGNSSGDIISFEGSVDTNIIPSTDNARDLGSSAIQWRDLYIDGTANIDNLQLNSGVPINEFSTDGTLGGNSNSVVPTEQAVKTYVDNNAGGGGGFRVPIRGDGSGFYTSAIVPSNLIFLEQFNPNVLYAIPFVPQQTMTIDALALEVQTAGTGTVDAWLGVYDSNADQYPNNRVARWISRIPLNSIGEKIVTITPSSVQLSANNLYWLVYQQENGTQEPEISSLDGNEFLVVMASIAGNLSTQDARPIGWQVNSTFSNSDMPNSFPAGGSIRGNNFEHPLIWVRVESVP